MQVNGPTMPFHLARAYGLNPVRHTPPAAPAPPAPATAPTHRAAEAQRPNGVREATAVDRFELTGIAKPSPAIARLVAGVVPGGIDFSGEAPAARPAALPFYAHPADRNAAATSLVTGRSLDVEG